MKLSSSSLFRRFIPAALAPLLIIQAYGQGYYELDGGTDTISTTFTFDGESEGDTHIPQPPYFEGAGQRDALLVFGGGSLSLTAGADVSVSNFDNHTAFARVGYGTDGTLNIGTGASFRVGHDGRYANFHVGHDATGTVNQTGGTTSLIGSVNIGANGGNGTYTISGGTFNFDHTPDGGTSLLSVGFNNSAVSTGTSSGVFNIDGGTVNILSSHGGGTRFIIGNRTDVALGTSDPSGAGNGTVNQTGGVFHIGAGADLYLSGYGDGVYNLSGGALEIGGDSLLARYGSGATGTYDFNLGGGTLRVTGSDLTSDVDINVVDNDPTVVVTASRIDTNGFNATLSGGINGDGALVKTGAGQLNLTGNVTRSLAYLSAAEGTVAHQAGTTTMGSLLVGAYSTSPSGSLELSGGVLNVTGADGAAYVGAGTGANSGTLSITGGTLNLGDSGDPATRVEFYVGAFGTSGTGTVNHSGGTVNKLSDEGTFQIGNQATGIYNLSGTGVVNIYGPNSMVLGRSSATNAGDGTLNVSGGTLNFLEGADMSIGGTLITEPAGAGTGTVNQTGGTISMGNGSVVIGQRGNGTYNLSGGVLEMGGTDRLRQGDGGSASFNLGGGTLRVAGADLTSSLDINVAAGNSTIDTNGLDATLSGSLSGEGALRKTGLGTLHLSGDNSLTTSLHIEGGGVSQTAGASSINYLAVGTGSGNTGSYTMAGGTLDVNQGIQVGDFGGSGTFNQTGGSITLGQSIPNYLNIGNQGGSGVFNLSGGSFEIANGFLNLGRSTQATAGTGELNISGTAELTIGDLADLIIGDRDGAGADGAGTVNQTGGTVRVQGNGELWVGAHGAGTYNLDGGRLEIGGAALKKNYQSTAGSTFNLGGGTIAVTGSALTTDVRLKLTDGTTSTIDTASFGATVDGFSGTGHLSKTGNSNLAIATDSTLGDLSVGEGTVTTSAAVTVNDLHMEVNTTFSGSGFLQVQGTFTGSGAIAIDTRITGTLAVGNSPGTMTVSSDMTIATGGAFEFDLTGNAAGTAGTTFDQITLSLGTFTMEDGSAFAILFDDVDFAASFWGMDQSWLVVDGDGTGDISLGDVILAGSQNHSPYGSFGLGADGDDMTLFWTPVPEPGPAVLLIAALAPLAAQRRRRNG